MFAGVEEAAIVTGATDPLDSALALEALGPRQVLIKLGAAGCLARIDGVTHELRAPLVTVTTPSAPVTRSWRATSPS